MTFRSAVKCSTPLSYIYPSTHNSKGKTSFLPHVNTRYNGCNFSASFSIDTWLSFVSFKKQIKKERMNKQLRLQPKDNKKRANLWDVDPLHGRVCHHVGVVCNPYNTGICAYFCGRSAHAFKKTRFLSSFFFLRGRG